MKFNHTLTLIIIGLVLPLGIAAQSQINSPFSRFGLGEIADPNFSALSSIGKLSAAYNSPYYVNYLNPASLPFLRTTAFSVGLNGKYSSYESNSGEGEQWTGNLSYLSLAFPLRSPINEALSLKKSPWTYGMSFNLLPYSNVGYDLEAKIQDAELGQITQKFSGNGGTYKFYWGNGVKYNNISAGLNVGYLFGKLEYYQEERFDSLTNSFANIETEDFNVGGFIWNLGVQYRHDFMVKNDKNELVASGKRLTVGAHASSPNNISTTGNDLTMRGRSFNAAVQRYLLVDTVSAALDTEGDGKLPAEFGFGITYEDFNSFLVGINYSFTAWKGYENEIRPENLNNSYTISLGGEYIPDHNSYKYYYKKIRYRLGAFYSKDPRVVLGGDITSYGLSFGIGLPVILPQQQQSFVDLGFEFGQQGNDNLTESYVKINVGFTLNNNTWFLKRKFN